LNNLNIELEGKQVVLSSKCYRGNEKERIFHCVGGFGCHPHTTGRVIFGYFIHSGEKGRVEGYEIEKLAEEVKY